MPIFGQHACVKTTQNSCFPYRPAKGWTGILTARGHLQAFISPLHGCFSWPWERLMRSKLKKPRRTWTLEFLSLGLPPKRTWEPLNYSKQQNERMATETNTVQASMNFYISTSYKSTIEFLKIGTNQPEDAPEFHAEKHSTTQSIDLIRATLLVLHAAAGLKEACFQYLSFLAWDLSFIWKFGHQNKQELVCRSEPSFWFNCTILHHLEKNS